MSDMKDPIHIRYGFHDPWWQMMPPDEAMRLQMLIIGIDGTMEMMDRRGDR